MKQSKIQNSLSPFNHELCSQKSSMIDVRLSSKYASDKLSFSSYSKVNASQIATFRFFTPNTDTLTILLTLILRMFT